MPLDEMARRAVGGVDTTSWDEAVVASKFLVAMVDRLEAAEDVSDLRRRLATVRTMLEFPEEEVGGRTVRFDSPHDYDPAALRRELEAIVSGIETRGR